MSGGDIDPGAPAAGGELAPAAPDAIAAANFGTTPPPRRDRSETRRGPHTVAIDSAAAQAFLHACMAAGVRYGLGAKAPFHGAVPGRDFTRIDCSGFVREALWHGGVAAPDGSVTQHDWAIGQGFVPGTIADAARADGIVRIAFLSPKDSPSGIGHVVLVTAAATLESHGGHGPDTRPWTGTGWQAHAAVYALTAPP